MQTIDSTTLEAATPKQMSQDVEFHSLASANLEHEKKMVRKDAAVYESFDDLTKTLVYAFQLTLICRCEPVQPIPPATITITGVATHYLTTSTVSSSPFFNPDGNNCAVSVLGRECRTNVSSELS